MYHAGIYCRLSMEEAGKEEKYSNSICSQIQMAEDYISGQKDIRQSKVYADDGVSGSNFNRPEFRRMLSDIEWGRIDTVILKDISRLGRAHIDTSYYLEKYFPERNIRVISILDGYDSKKDRYDELLELKTLLNDMYLRDTSCKIKTIIQTKRRLGEYTPKEPPFGYLKSKTIRNHLETDPYAAEIVRRIFEMYLAGKGGTIIARTLNEDAIPAPAKYKKEVLKTDYAWKVGKGLWTVSSVMDILTNPVYTGAVVMKKMEKPSYKSDYRRKIPLEERELIEDAHEAIVSKKEFEQVQTQRKANRVSYFDKRSAAHKYKGLLFCGKCGSVMRKRYLASRADYDGYVCGFHQKMGKGYCERNDITFEKLDELVVFAINGQLKKLKEEWQELQRKDLRVMPEFHERKIFVQKMMERNREHQKKAYEKFMDDILSQSEYLKLKKIYEDEIVNGEKDLYKLEQKEQEWEKMADETAKWLVKFQQRKITEKQLTGDVLSELIEKIYVYPCQKLEIHFKFVNPVSKV